MWSGFKVTCDTTTISTFLTRPVNSPGTYWIDIRRVMDAELVADSEEECQLRLSPAISPGIYAPNAFSVEIPSIHGNIPRFSFNY